MNSNIQFRHVCLFAACVLAAMPSCRSVKLHSPDAAAASKMSPVKPMPASPRGGARVAGRTKKPQRDVSPESKARDVISDAKLSELMAEAPRMKDFMPAKLKPVGDSRPNPDVSAYSNSIILFDGDKHTVIPYGAILNLPEKLRERVVAAPAGGFLLWPRFLKRNEQWLASREVPLEMAKGNKETASTVMRNLVDSPKLLVSVYRGNPISILEEEQVKPGNRQER